MRVLSLAVLLLVGSACNNNTTNVTPPTFERPGDVAFFCLETADGSFRSLDECRDLDGDTEESLGLTALVTQTARGEVATVDLREATVLDADLRVPGFTFVRVGELPSALVVPPEDPSVTYVASFGSRRVEYYPTARFRPGLQPGILAESGSVAVPGGPVDLVLGPGGQALFAALPARGELLRIERAPDGSLLQPTESDLTTLAPDLPAPAMASGPSPYRRICIGSAQGEPQLRLPSVTSTEVVPVPEGAIPKPVDMEIVQRPEGFELLIADGTLPLLHRFQVSEEDTLTALPPIATGVPITSFVVTPEVPEDLAASTSATARYIYAIDATDGSVLVLDYTDPAAPGFGAVLPVHVGDGPAHRVDLESGALSLAVLTPGFPGEVCMTPSDEIGPRVLRGVFVAVGLANGFVQVIDILDLDAPCRAGNASCAPRTEGGDARDVDLYIQRHRPRIGDFVTTGIAATTTPSFAFEGSPGRLGDNGRPSSMEGPGLASITCPSFQGRIFPAEEMDTTRLCAVVDPWAARSENWEARWEGTIPFTRGGLGRFPSTEEAGALGLPQRDGLITFAASDAQFCSRGVLGRDDVAASGLGELDPERGYTGDRLVITSDPPEDLVEANERCLPFVADEDGIRPEELTFDIVEAHGGALLVVPAQPGMDALARDCYAELFGYEVRVGAAFAVVGARSGFLHRVVGGEAGCRIDTRGQPIDPADPDTYRNGRAFDQRLYLNPYVAFQIDLDPMSDAPITLPRETDARLTFAVGNVPLSLFADIGVRGRGSRISAVIESLRYNASDERLYAIDANSDALATVALAPFARQRIFE